MVSRGIFCPSNPSPTPSHQSTHSLPPSPFRPYLPQVKDLSRGLKLFHSLYPPLHAIPEEAATRDRNIANKERITVGQTNTDRNCESRAILHTVRRQASDIGLAAGMGRWGIERDLDAEMKKIRRNYRKTLKIKTQIVPIKRDSIVGLPPQDRDSSPESLSPQLKPSTPVSERKSQKVISRISLPVYIKLPQLPFGSHRTYNEIISLRNMMISPDEEAYCSEPTGRRKKGGPADTTRSQGEDEGVVDYSRQAKAMYQNYLVESDSALTSGKRLKKRTLPARFLKYINDTTR